MDILELQSICKQYEEKPLLDRLNLSVRAGQILCLLGRSGSGKSTLLRIIAGIENADSGVVLWNGQDVSGIPVHQRGFGLMFQDYSLFPHMTVAQNIAFGPRMSGRSSTESKDEISQALERVNLSGFENRRVTELSGGEQQRVALARSLAARPRLLMLDEPLAALDQSLRTLLQQDLRAVLEAAGLPVIYVTHNQEEAAAMADQVALLHEGRIVQEGTTETVFAQPACRWAAEFLGMKNFISGKLVSRDPILITTAVGNFQPRRIPSGSSSEITLLIKPTVEAGSGRPGDLNSLTGTVGEVSFRGDYYRFSLITEYGLILEFNALHKPVTDKKITIAFPPDSLIAYLD